MKNKFLIYLLALTTIAGANPKISNIEITNLKEIPEETVRELLPVKVGDEYSNKVLSDIFLNLTRNAGIISNVNIYPTDNADDNVSLKIVVDEAKDANKVLQYTEYVKKLQEKTDFTINDIKINGTNEDLKEILNKSNLKVGDVYVPYNSELFKELILTSGYFSNVDLNIKQNADKTLDLEFNVTENPRIKSIEIRGSSLVTEDELIKLSGLKVGDILNTRLLTVEGSPIIQSYAKSGFLWSGFSGVNVSKDGDVVIDIFEGKVKEVIFEKKTTQRDNERISERDYKLKTQDFVLERNNYLTVGSVLNQKNIEETLTELFRTGLFSALNHEIIPDPSNPDQFTIKIIATERPTTSISANISYSTEDSFTGSLKLSDSNFLGKEQNFDLTGEAGVKGNYNISLGFKDPWIKGTDRLLAGVNAYLKKTLTRVKDIEEFKKSGKTEAEYANSIYNQPTAGQYVFGITGQLGKGLNKDVYLSTTARLVNVRARNKVAEEDSRLYQDYTLGALGFDLSYDTRDDRAVPKNGFYGNVYGELGYIFRERSLIFGNDNRPQRDSNNQLQRLKTRSYYTFSVDLRAYHPVYKDKNSMAYRLLANYSNPKTPSGQLSVVGDGLTLRGLQKAYSGNMYSVTLNVENRTYVNNYIQGVLFFDAGIAYNIRVGDSENKKAPLRFVYTAGLGARINTPLGIIRLDYGWDLSNLKNNKSGKFTFGFGPTF